MQAIDLLRLVWSKLSSLSVDKCEVQQALGEVLAADLGERGLLSDEISRWVLGQVMIAVRGFETLVNGWSKANRVASDVEALEPLGVVNDVASQEYALRANEINKALGALLDKGLVIKISNAPEMFTGSLGGYLKLIEGSNARPETGPMVFEGDWPGVFIRGDNSHSYVRTLRQYWDLHPVTEKGDLVELNLRFVLQNLAGILASSRSDLQSPDLPCSDVPMQRMRPFGEALETSSEVADLRRQVQALQRECNRLRQGNTIESDFVDYPEKV